MFCHFLHNSNLKKSNVYIYGCIDKQNAPPQSLTATLYIQFLKLYNLKFCFKTEKTSSDVRAQINYLSLHIFLFVKYDYVHNYITRIKRINISFFIPI